ncbi:MAG: DUF2961 domain-containing protein, partial [Clostridiales bacterium]|nr:DUF2961 domain-containing protein [Clostridiales bacterium]
MAASLFNGFGMDIGSLWRLSDAKTRSISPENPRGEPGRGGAAELGEGSSSGAARDLGRGWKVNPCVSIGPGATLEIADIEGPGMIQHVWMTPTGAWRDTILRVYWDGQDEPSVECPIGDFFCMGWNKYSQISSLAVCVNPGSAFNCYWPMPFAGRCRMTLENRAPAAMTIFYQITYALGGIGEQCAYFHASFRRSNPLAYKAVHEIAGGLRGKGQYVGTYIAWGVNNNGWWGEGEIKFFMDGDAEFPTICGTGTEDYFCGSYDFEDPVAHDRYVSFSTPYTGFHVLDTDKLYGAQRRFGMYRWHIADPIRFESDLRVTIQALGWRSEGRYLPLQDDIASVAYWYQTLPASPLPPLQSRDSLEV